MYQILEASLADLSRLYQFMLADLFKANFSLKGFDYPWLLTIRRWQAGEKVLDVGAAYSPLPIHIQRTYGCEVWVADDFGLESGEAFWTRSHSPHEHIAQHPEVKYVLERLGNPQKSSLPSGYFDVIYSLSALEHVPTELAPAVWRHMDSLLKPGGEMLHAIDLSFPSNGGVKKLLLAALFDALYPLAPQGIRQKRSMSTPRAYVRMACQALGIPSPSGKDLSVWRMCLDPDILSENPDFGLHRIRKDKMTDYRYQRAASLLLRLKKVV